MKITSLDIDRFGIWNELHIAKLSEGLNVFYGPNEAGKTTLMQFVRAILYGFEGERLRYVRNATEGHEYKHGHPLGPGTNKIIPAIAPEKAIEPEGEAAQPLELPLLPGGGMNVLCPNGQFSIRRTYDPEAQFGHEEILKLTSIDGKKQGEHLLRMIVSGVDEPTFNNVFAIGLDEIQKLAVLNDTEAGDMLFRLSIGLDRVSLVEVIKELTSSRNRIVDPGGAAKGQYERMLVQRAKLLEELGRPKLQLREYCRILNEQRQLDRIIAQLQENMAVHQQQERLYETAMRIIPIWDRREALRLKLESMGYVIPVDDEAILKLDEFNDGLAKRREQLKRHREQYLALKSERESRQIDETLWKLTPRIEILLEEEPRIIELDRQISQLEEEATELEEELAEEERQIRSGKRTLRAQNSNSLSGNHDPERNGNDSAKGNPNSNQKGGKEAQAEPAFQSTASPAKMKEAARAKRVPDHQDRDPLIELADYRIYARQVRRSRIRVKRYREEHESLKERTKILNEKVRSELAKRDLGDLTEAIEKTSEAVTHLRRGQALSQRLGEMMQFRKELDRQNAFLIQNQALPMWMIASFIGVFAFGLILFLGWWYWSNPALGVMGLIFCVGSIIFPMLLLKNNAKKLEHNQRQLSQLISQLEHTKQELAAIDSRFPGAGTPIENRFQNAQSELAALEKLLPIDAQRREATHQFKIVEERLNAAKESLSNANRKWLEWLKAASLPGDWNPQQVRDLIDRYDEVGGLRRELEFRYESLTQRIRELRHLTERIDRMIKEIGMSFDEGISYIDILNEIRLKLRENDEAVRRRDVLRKEMKKLNRQGRKMQAAYASHLLKRDTHLAGYGIEKPEELRQLQDRYKDALKLEEQLGNIGRELAAGIGGVCKEETMAEMMEPEQRDSLPNLLRAEQKAINMTQTQLIAEVESHGRLSEQLENLANDESPLKKRRELAILDEKIKELQQKWRVYALTCRMLEMIRHAYERERQPQTLAEASDYLRRLTRGRYRRVWTPLGEDTLLIDDYRDSTLDASWFSRGTREQLFVAIRLALTSSFAQHGSALPMILDDVLVNFDTPRAQAAARVLKEVAESGRQIFLFTCHEHICRIFQDLDVPVRILPSFADPKKQIRVLLPKSTLKARRRKARREAARIKAEEAAARRSTDTLESPHEERIAVEETGFDPSLVGSFSEQTGTSGHSIDISENTFELRAEE